MKVRQLNSTSNNTSPDLFTTFPFAYALQISYCKKVAMILAGLHAQQVLQQVCYNRPLWSQSISVQVFSNDSDSAADFHVTKHTSDLLQNNSNKQNSKEVFQQSNSQLTLEMQIIQVFKTK
ncbi:hypothetical protein OIU79_007193, partial [Salix purpurea]